MDLAHIYFNDFIEMHNLGIQAKLITDELSTYNCIASYSYTSQFMIINFSVW